MSLICMHSCADMWSTKKLIKYKVVNHKVHFWRFWHTFGVQVTLWKLNMAEKDNKNCHSTKSDEITRNVGREGKKNISIAHRKCYSLTRSNIT